MKIGVFDSGIGGKAIAESLASDLPGGKQTPVEGTVNN
jgi:glutamate racemase